MKSPRKLLVALALVALACSCQQARLKRVRVAPEGVCVKVQTVTMTSNASQKAYVGTVEVSKEASINASTSGTLTKLYVKQGAKVSQGQVLAEITSQTVKSSYDAAMAALRQAEDGYARVKKVYDTGSVPEVKLVEIQTKLEQARASAAAARNALEQCKVRAPFAGEVADISILQGEKVVVAQPLLTLVDARGLDVVVSIPEIEAFDVKVGDKATVLFPSLDRKLEAVVKTRAVVGSSLSHSYKCTLSMGKVGEDVLPGMVCKVYLLSDSISGIVVPADVVKLDSDGKYVWTVDSLDRVCKVRIVTNGFSGKGVIVVNGLNEGDRIIVEGTSKVSTGMSVKVKE